MLGIVAIDYKNPQLTIEFCQKQLLRVDVPYVCVVVVNGATDEEVNCLAQGTGAYVVREDASGVNKGQRLYLLPSVENLGFARGNNLGVAFLTKHFGVEHLLFSNTDIEILSPNCVSVLLDRLNRNGEMGAIGPCVVGLDGQYQEPHDRVISIYRQIGWMLFPFLRKRRIVDASAPARKPESRYTYWVQGSFLLVRRSDFERVGMFDPHTFLYSEEPILAERLKRIGKRMYYEASVEILHYEGGTIVRKHGSKRSARMAMESNCYYYRTYLHVGRFAVWIYRQLSRLQ